MGKFKKLFTLLFMLLFSTILLTNKIYALDLIYSNDEISIYRDNKNILVYNNTKEKILTIDLMNNADDTSYYYDEETGSIIYTIDPPSEQYNQVGQVKAIDPNENTKYVALTFDDGPSSSTPKLLNALHEYNAKATFFLVGQMIANLPDTVRMIYYSGNEIGEHTYDHADLTKLSTSDIRWEIEKTRDMIKSITGEDPTLLRPSYGSHNNTVDSIAGSYNLPIILWNVDPEDWKYLDADIVYNSISSKLQDGNIILIHDSHPSSVEAAIRILRDYSNKGYKFVTVSELAAIKGIDLIPGQFYFDFTE